MQWMCSRTGAICAPGQDAAPSGSPSPEHDAGAGPAAGGRARRRDAAAVLPGLTLLALPAIASILPRPAARCRGIPNRREPAAQSAQRPGGLPRRFGWLELVLPALLALPAPALSRDVTLVDNTANETVRSDAFRLRRPLETWQLQRCPGFRDRRQREGLPARTRRDRISQHPGLRNFGLRCRHSHSHPDHAGVRRGARAGGQNADSPDQPESRLEGPFGMERSRWDRPGAELDILDRCPRIPPVAAFCTGPTTGSKGANRGGASTTVAGRKGVFAAFASEPLGAALYRYCRCA